MRTRGYRLQKKEEVSITDAFLNIHYPCDSWTRVYTDDSAENAVRNGGAGVCVQHSVDDEEHVSIPTGLHSTNYKAEVTLDIDLTAGVSSNKPILDPSSDSVTIQMVRHSQSKVL